MTATLTDLAAVVVAVAIPLCTWVFSRIGKARQLETHTAISAAVDRSQEQISQHIDERLEATDKRIDALARSVQAIDAREDETRLELAHLKGRFDQAQDQRQAGN